MRDPIPPRGERLRRPAPRDMERTAPEVIEMTLVEAQGRIEQMVGAGASFESLEDFVESGPFPELQKSALWLLAWSCQDPPTQRRVVKEALALAAC